MTGQSKVWMLEVTQHRHRRGRHCVFHHHSTAVSMNGTHQCRPGRSARLTAFTLNMLHSHVVEPVTHGGARSARVGPWISCSPGVRAAHYGAPHAWFVHPVRWSMELDGRMACAHRLTHIHSPSSPSQSQTQAAREQCV